MTILIHDTGKADGWCIEDRDENHSGWLACYDTQKKAIKRARNKWAAPGQPIRIVGPNPRVVREGDPNWKQKLNGNNSTKSDGFGIGLF